MYISEENQTATDDAIVRRLNAVIALQVVVLGVLVVSTSPTGLLPIYAIAGVLLAPMLVLAVLNGQS